MNWIIDRFEEDLAVAQDSKTMETINISKKELPPEVKPGDTIENHDGEWLINRQDTSARAHRIKIMFDRIKRR